jgi:hypothetical protein
VILMPEAEEDPVRCRTRLVISAPRLGLAFHDSDSELEQRNSLVVSGTMVVVADRHSRAPNSASIVQTTTESRLGHPPWSDVDD